MTATLDAAIRYRAELGWIPYATWYALTDAERTRLGTMTPTGAQRLLTGEVGAIETADTEPATPTMHELALAGLVTASKP